MSQENKLKENLHKFLFEQKVSLSSTENKLDYERDKIHSDTIAMKNSMAQWISAIDRKELITKLKTFLLTYPSIESIHIGASWQYAKTESNEPLYQYTPNYNIYFLNYDNKGLVLEDLEDELMYDLDLFDNFSSYEMENMIEHLSDVNLKNIDSLFDLITDKDDMDAFLSVENYEKNEIEKVLLDKLGVLESNTKKQKI